MSKSAAYLLHMLHMTGAGQGKRPERRPLSLQVESLVGEVAQALPQAAKAAQLAPAGGSTPGRAELPSFREMRELLLTQGGPRNLSSQVCSPGEALTGLSSVLLQTGVRSNAVKSHFAWAPFIHCTTSSPCVACEPTEWQALIISAVFTRGITLILVSCELTSCHLYTQAKSAAADAARKLTIARAAVQARQQRTAWAIRTLAGFCKASLQVPGAESPDAESTCAYCVSSLRDSGFRLWRCVHTPISSPANAESTVMLVFRKDSHAYQVKPSRGTSTQCLTRHLGKRRPWCQGLHTAGTPQEDRFGVLQLTQPDVTATLQLLLSAQLALSIFARRAVLPRPPTLAGRLWGAAAERLRRLLGFAATKGASARGYFVACDTGLSSISHRCLRVSYRS